MPKRTNFFQQVVAIIHRHARDEGTTVTESEELSERATGVKREVDVVIRRTVAGHVVTVSVEATAASEPADVTWIDEMISKHADLPTSTLVLVSESGFTPNAEKKAEMNGAVMLAPSDMEEPDFEAKVVGHLAAIFPKALALTFDNLYVTVETPEETVTRKVPFDVALYREDGTPACNPLAMMERWIDKDFPEVAEMIGLLDVTEDIDQWFQGGNRRPPWDFDGTPVDDLYLHDASGERHRLLSFEVNGRASIRVGEVALTHKRLGDFGYAYGQAEFDGQSLGFVSSVTDQGEKATLIFDSKAIPLKTNAAAGAPTDARQ